MSTLMVEGDVYQTLRERGLVDQETPGLAGSGGRVRTVYAGFDPTAKSLHVGNLALLMALGHFGRMGHRPIALIGGATGRIGDPSGRAAERELLGGREVEGNAEGLRRDVQGFWEQLTRHAGGQCAGLQVVDNVAWYRERSVLDFLGEAGPHFRVKKMLAKDSMRSRMDSSDPQHAGPTFLELSYAVFQAYDYWHLHRHHACTLQLGGSDQWGNITAGCELIRRLSSPTSNPDNNLTLAIEPLDPEAHALTIPLVTAATGEKIGKSAGNAAVWLSPELTSDLDFYQFFLRTSDADAARYLRVFTFLPLPAIAAVEAEHRAAPEHRAAQRLLAEEVTRIVRGEAALQAAQLASQTLFAPFDLRGASWEELLQRFAACPPLEIASASVLSRPLVDLIVVLGLLPSKTEARKMIQNGGVSLNNVKVASPSRIISPGDLLADQQALLLRIGKKSAFLIRCF